MVAQLDARKTANVIGQEDHAGTRQETRHIDSLRPHPDNPRDEIREDDPKIQELASSIIRYGILEPLVINKDNILYAGHRRRVASRVAYKRTREKKFLIVPVTINDTPPEAAAELMLQENMQRESLTPLEEARAMAAIKERNKFNVADLARHLEMPPATCSLRLCILRLEPEVQLLYAANEVPLGAAALLQRVASPEKQISYAGMLARRQITVAEFKKAAEKDLAEQPPETWTLGEPPAPRRARTRVSPIRGVSPSKKRGSAAVALDGGRSRLNPTRGEALASLGKALGGRVSLISVKSVVESVCCSCGMSGQEEVCRSCPLPRVILGIVGRADGVPSRPQSRSDEDDL
jgi:ParB family chromosome partitioning protein